MCVRVRVDEWESGPLYDVLSEASRLLNAVVLIFFFPSWQDTSAIWQKKRH